MFKKIISNLYFSPALIEQFSKYGKNIKKELSIRKVSLFLSFLTLLLLSLTFIQQKNYTIDKNDTNVLITGITKNQSIFNISQQKQNGFVAQPGDKIAITLYIKNNQDIDRYIEITDNINDMLEYSTISDLGNGSYNKITQNLTWNIELSRNETQTRTFIIEILKEIPQKAKNKSSYDCIISNNFGKTLNINIEKPLFKKIESTLTSLPKINKLTTIIFIIILVLINLIFFIRTNQIKKEIKIIRKEIVQGHIKL